jgi:DNA-directed RNA polymerase specialized sigma24 family protein
MQKLPVDLWEAIILKYYQDLTFEEIAAITGDSLSAVKMHVYRALKIMKKIMQD